MPHANGATPSLSRVPQRQTVAHGDPDGSVVLPLGISLAEAEQKLILATMAHYGRQKERTAAALGISLKTLYNRLKQYAAEDQAVQGGSGTSANPPP